MFLDVLLWILVLAGVEHYHTPVDYARRHYLAFDFPYSHSLAGAVVWSILAATIAGLVTRKSGTAAVFAAAVFSHWPLDVLVHPPQIAVTPVSPPALGLGWWNHLYLALGAEGLLLAAGWMIYRRTVVAGRRGLAIFLGLLAAFAFGGQLWAPPPASRTQLAASSLITLLIVFSLAAWLDRKPRPA